jgi:hypothetical protein
MPRQIGTSIRANTRKIHSGDREADAIDAAGLAQAQERLALKLACAHSVVTKRLALREAAIRLKVGKTALYEALRLANHENTPPATSNG